MKRNLKKTAYYKLVKVFYPSGVTEGDLFGTTADQTRKSIEAELQQVANELCDGIVMRKSHFESSYTDFDPEFRFPKLELTNLDKPLVHATADGGIKLDIRVVQSLFIGSLAYAEKGSSPDDEFARPFHAQQPDPTIQLLPESQKRDLVVKALRLVEDIDQARARRLLGDLLSDDSSWFRLSDVSAMSVQLERAYWNSVRFLIAHEIGHIALGHDPDERGESPLHREFAADRFAISALTGGEGGEAVQRVQRQFLNSLIGNYDGFVIYLAYTYDLIKFHQNPSTTAAYPSPSERLAQALHHARTLEQQGVGKLEAELEEWRRRYETR